MDAETNSYPRLTTLLTREGMSEQFRACYFDSYPPATDDYIQSLLAAIPWLPDDYVDFLRITNGCVLEFFVFYGLGKDHHFPIENNQWQLEEYGTDRWFAVGHDCSGDTMAINRDGGIGTVGSDPPPDEPVPLCSTFHDLIEHVCCGQGYAEYFKGNVDESDWFAHIKSHGWAE